MFNACKVASLGTIYELIRNGANINHVSQENGKTPLFKARTDEVVMLLLKHGADPYIRSKANDVDDDTKATSAIKHLMKFNSACATAILTDCLSRQQDDLLILDFKVFDEEDIQNKDEMAVFNNAIKYERKDLLLHPLMQIFLFMKVRNFKFQFWMQFFFKLACAITLTYFGIAYADFNHCEKLTNLDVRGTPKNDCFKLVNGHIGCPYNETHSRIENLTWNSDILPIQCNKNTLEPTMTASMSVISKALGHVGKTRYFLFLGGLLTLVAILVLRELIEIFALRREYLSREENYLQWLIIFMIISFCLTCHKDLDTAQHLASWMVFLAWLDITLLLGEMDRIGECVYMSIDVMKNMLLCFSIYIPSLLGFSYGFYILINPTESFNSWFGAMVKVMAMSIGELDYTSNFDYHNLDKVGGKNFSSQVMIVGFIFTIALVMMNVLLAVTLSKTEDLEQKSKIMQSERMVNEIVVCQLKGMKIIFDKLKYLYCSQEFTFSKNKTRQVGNNLC